METRTDAPPAASAAATTDRPPPLQATGLLKAFAGVPVLRGVDLTVVPGRVHALLGSNGSGKSTFVKLVTGTYEADEGSQIVLGGQAFGTDLTPATAREHGVRTVHQEAPLIGQMTVAEHFGLDRGFPKGGIGWVRQRELARTTRAALERVGASIDPATLAKDLLPAERAQVALALALTDVEPGRGLLVLDEATALLPAPDAKPMLDQVSALAAEGLGVLMVTHRLGEVTAHCHDVTVLRDGAVVLQGAVADHTHDDLVGAMVGRTRDEVLAAHHARVKRKLEAGVAPILTVKGLKAKSVEDVSLEVRPGEILGIAGIVGSGASEVARAIAGCDARDAGDIEVDGKPAGRRWSPSAAIKRGVAYVPQDRHAEGGVLTLGLGDNVVLPRFARYWRRKDDERKDVDGVVTGLEVHPPLPKKPFAEFSGGNQQKAMLGKWLLLKPKVLVLDDPTYGVDPNARETLLAAISAAADEGTGVIVVSTEPEQLARICDRVLVMRQNRISAELTEDHINEVEISLACFS